MHFLVIFVMTLCVALMGAVGPAKAEVAGAYLAGQHALRHDDNPQAADYLAEVLSLDPDNDRLRQALVLVSAMSGDMDAAAIHAEPLVAKKADDEVLHLVTMLRDVRMAEFQQAKNSLASVPNPLTFLLVSAWLEAAQGDYDQALGLVAPVGDDSAEDLLRRYMTGCLLFLQGRFDEALAEFSEVVRFPSGLKTRALLASAEVLRQQGDRSLLRGFLKGHENDFARVRVVEDKFGNPQLPTILPRRPVDGVAESFRAMALLLSREDTAQRVLLFDRASLYLRPQQPELRLELALALMDLDARDEASSMLQSIKMDPHYGWLAVTELAFIEAEAGKLDDARRLMMPLLGDEVVGARASRHLADILRQEKFFQEAVTYYEQAEKGLTNPDWRFYFTKGIAQEQSQNWSEAEQSFQKSLKLNPGQPVVMNYLAYSWVDRDINLEQALEMVAEAAEKRPQDGYIIDSLAWAHFKLGNLDEALRLMERAHELAPTDPTIAEHHGDVLEKVGHVREAVFMWKRALKRVEDKEDLARLRDKIKRLAQD